MVLYFIAHPPLASMTRSTVAYSDTSCFCIILFFVFVVGAHLDLSFGQLLQEIEKAKKLVDHNGRDGRIKQRGEGESLGPFLLSGSCIDNSVLKKYCANVRRIPHDEFEKRLIIDYRKGKSDLSYS